MKSKIVEIDGKLYMTVGGVVLYEIERTEETNEQEIENERRRKGRRIL